MKSALKNTAAIACGLLVGGGAVQLLHAQSKPPAFVVAEIAVRDQKGYDKNFLNATRRTSPTTAASIWPEATTRPRACRAAAAQPCRHPPVPEHGRGQGVARRGCDGRWRTPSAASTPRFASMP